MRRVAWCVAAALGWLLSGCGQDSAGPVAAGGNGSETTNGFSLRVINQDGTAASDVAVHIRLSDSLAGNWGDSLIGTLRTRLDTVSDPTGLVSVDGLVSGNFTVSLVEGISRSLSHQTAGPGLPYGGTVQLGQASYPRLVDTRIAGCTLDLFGVNVQATADSTGDVQFDSLPVGTYTFRAWKGKTRIGDGTMLVQTGTTASLLNFAFYGAPGDPTAYAHADAISIDASVAGANVAGTLYGFPVPLALDNTNFDFSGSSPSGIMLIGPAGTVLPYSVESWDSVAGQALLWFRMDSLLALHSQQNLQLYWKGPQVSSSEPVFDTANGWWGVWHLDQSLQDATPRKQAATGSAAGVDGWTSNGTNTLTFPSLPESSDSGFTLSLWLLPDTSQRAGAPIVRQYTAGNGSVTFALRMGPFSTWIEVDYPDGTTTKNNFPTVSAQGDWLCIAVTYDRIADEMLLYLDGQQWGEPTTNLGGPGKGTAGALVLGGADSAGVGFTGLVKDVRMSSKPRSAAWLNAEYAFEKVTVNSPISIQRLR
jgi:hypothetical protein